MIRRLPLPVLLLALGACRAGGDGISRDEFVRLNVALRMVPDTAAAARERRTEILEHAGVTPAQLERWVRRHPRDAAEVWREIAAKVDSAHQPPPQPGDSAAAPGGVNPPTTGTPPPPSAGSLDEILRDRGGAKPIDPERVGQGGAP